MHGSQIGDAGQDRLKFRFLLKLVILMNFVHIIAKQNLKTNWICVKKYVFWKMNGYVWRPYVHKCSVILWLDAKIGLNVILKPSITYTLGAF